MLALPDLLAAGARLHGDAHATTFADLSYDSRLTRPGELFVALRTAHADGHEYIPAALAAGASGILCAYPPPHATATTLLQADDPTSVLQHWAARRLRQVAPLVLAVSGSIGKTSAVAAITTLLREQAPTFRTRGSFNSLLGVPIALARLDDSQRFAVLEFGADQFGELARLATLFPPQIAVLTNIAEVHLAAFGSLEDVAREQAALLQALPPTGWALLNGDDPYLAGLHTQTTAQVLRFGRAAGCDLRAEQVRLTPHGTHMRLIWQTQPAEAFVRLLGEPAVTTTLAAVAAALACGIPFERAVANLALLEPLAGRLRLLAARGGAQILDDTFSTSLPSVRAAFDTLAALPAVRRMVVLGMPQDVPPDRARATAEIGALAAATDLLIGVGDAAAPVVQAAQRSNPALQALVADTVTAALAALPEPSAGDLVLIKGGAEHRLEHVTAGLLDTPHAPGLLVRQEAAWRSVRVGVPDRPTWLRIDLDAIGANVRRLHDLAGVSLMITLKADAYGHGAVRTARTALMHGAQALAVATVGEARVLREAGVAAPILVLGYTPPWQAHELLELRVACTIFDLETAMLLADTAAARERVITVHLKVDTGMARLGIAPHEAGAFLHALAQRPGLHVAGIYTHFATADSADQTFARGQLQRFTAMLHDLAAAGLRPPVAHAANSAALLRFPEARFDMVRPGIACYGLQPSPETPLPPEIRPALSFHTEIAQVKAHPPGTPISYGGVFVTRRYAQIATIPVGYADGFRREPHWRWVLVRGQRAPIVGRINMDYTMIDVTDIPGVRRGDPVVLIGSQGNDTITADDVAGWLGTINYEVVSTILPRVPRV